jgi:hypothetical protein
LCWTYAERCPDEEYPETYWVLDSEGKPVKQIFPQECSPMGAANDSPPPSSKANIVLRVLVEEEVRKYVIPALRANAEAIRSLLWFSAQHEAPTAETPLHEGPLPQNLIPFFARLAWLAAAGSDSAAYAWLSDHYVVVGVFVGDHYVGPWSELFLSYGYCTFSSDRGSYRTTNLETMTPARAVYVDHDEEYRAAGLKEIIDFQPSEEQVAEGDLTVKWGDRFKTVCDIPSEYLLRCGRTKLLEIERVELGPSPEESEEELAALVDLHNFLEGELAAPEEMPSPPCTVKERCELVNEAFQELGIE